MKPCKNNPKLKCINPVYCENYQCDKFELTQDNCGHADTSTVVLEIVSNCEKTAIQCDYCGKIVTEPKTECR